MVGGMEQVQVQEACPVFAVEELMIQEPGELVGVVEAVAAAPAALESVPGWHCFAEACFDL